MAKKKTAKPPPQKQKQPKTNSPTDPTTSGPPDYPWIAEDLRPLAEPVESLTLDPANARTHDEANLASTAASLKQFGQVKPIVVNRRNAQIVAGNGTYLAATKTLGWTHIAVVWVQQDAAAQRGFSIADNRTAELAGWDDALLQTQLALIEEQTPDLFEALLLDDLRAEEEEEEEPADGGGDGDFKKWTYQVIVDCESELRRKQLLDRLRSKGHACRSVTW